MDKVANCLATNNLWDQLCARLSKKETINDAIILAITVETEKWRPRFEVVDDGKVFTLRPREHAARNSTEKKLSPLGQATSLAINNKLIELCATSSEYKLEARDAMVKFK